VAPRRCCAAWTGGMKQRASIAMALEPKLVLAACDVA
jgi:ABC-type dipeptide/oligopeptide/nickel transport system ATPase component